MNDRSFQKIFSHLNDMIGNSLFAGHIFLGDADQIREGIINFHGNLESCIDFSEKWNGKAQDIKIGVGGCVASKKKIRIWKIQDRDEFSESFKDYLGFLACIDPEELYTAWEKQSDLTILEAIEMAFLSYRRKREILRRGIRAAVAAIMSRNMSHNIGSHVLSYLINEYLLRENGELARQLSNVLEQKIVGDIVNLALEYKGKDSDTDILGSIPDVMNDKKYIEKFIKNNRYLFKYLKDRMDFIATVLTYVPSCATLDLARDLIGWNDGNPSAENWQDAVNFDTVDNSGVYGCSKGGVGHFFGDLNLLLNYICASEKIAGQTEITRDKIQISLEPYRSPIPVAIPGGDIGKQAFLTIVENIVRNCAKHGASSMKSPKNVLNFCIKLPDVDAQSCTYNRDDLMRVTITDNVGDAPHTIRKIKKALEEDIVDNSGELKRRNLGLKEMKVSAAFLRGIDPRDIMGNENEKWGEGPAKKLIDARKNSDDCLEFSFFLLKPKQILIITDNEKLELGDEFKKYGIDLIKTGTSECKQLISRYKTDKLRYRFILNCLSNTTELTLENDFLPRRWVEGDVSQIQDTITPAELLRLVYEKWIKEHFHLTDLPIVFVDRENRSYFNDQIKKMPTWKNLNDSTAKIIYCNHFDFERPQYWLLMEQIKKNANFIEEKKIKAIDSITGSNSSHARFENPSDPDLLRLELIEASLTKVLIIDERLYKARSKRKCEVMDWKGIHVWDLHAGPNNDLHFKLLEPDKSVGITICSDTSDFVIHNSGREYDFLAIHQGIIDKLLKKCLRKCNDNLNHSEKEWLEIILKSLGKLAAFPIIHSGRGKTEHLLEGWRFMGFSQLESWFMSDDKYELVQGLYGIVGR